MRGFLRIRVESDRCQRTFAPRHLGQLPGESPVATAEFENALPRQQMHHMAKRLRSPEHAVINNRILSLPIRLPQSLPESQRVGHGIYRHRHDAATRGLTTIAPPSQLPSITMMWNIRHSPIFDNIDGICLKLQLFREGNALSLHP